MLALSCSETDGRTDNTFQQQIVCCKKIIIKFVCNWSRNCKFQSLLYNMSLTPWVRMTPESGELPGSVRMTPESGWLLSQEDSWVRMTPQSGLKEANASNTTQTQTDCCKQRRRRHCGDLQAYVAAPRTLCPRSYTFCRNCPLWNCPQEHTRTLWLAAAGQMLQ